MINHMPFFRSPFYPYSHSYPKTPYHMATPVSTDKKKSSDNNVYTPTEIRETGDIEYQNKENIHEKKSSKYYHISPIFINTNGFSNKEEPVLDISGQKLYLDDLIILSLLFFLYKEDVKDDMLFMLLILLLVS